MRKLTFSNKLVKTILHTITALALIGVFAFAPAVTTNVAAASVTTPINMIYYGWHDATVDSRIINAHPKYLVDNSPAGPWKGNANINTFTAAGINYFEYIDGGYEGTAAQTIPNDLQSNLNYINAAATAKAYGIFVDEVSSNPSAASLNYLKQIADRAHSLGLKVAFNIGVDSWSDSLMTYCDFMSSSEIWNNTSLTTSQSKWASKTWLLSYNITSSTTAANLTNAAIRCGIVAHYACTSYGALPTWLETYVSQISSSTPTRTPTPTPTPAPVSGANTMGTVASKPITTGASNEYAFNLIITGTTVTGVTVGQRVWCAAFTTDFPNLLTVGVTLTGNLDHSAGWWVFKKASGSTPTPTRTPTPTPTLAPVSGANTMGTVANKPVTTGTSNEYAFNLMITSTTVSGAKAGQQVWCAASTTDFPNLLTVGVTLTGNLDHSAGWWVLKSIKP